MVTLALIGIVGGLITGVSPCVLPMLPIIFFAGGTGASGTTAAPRGTTASGTGAGSASGGPSAGGVAIDVVELAPPRPRRDLRPLKIIAGLVLSFSVFTLIGATLLSALGLPDDLLRWSGLTILALVGLGLIFPRLGHLIEKPFYRLPKINNNNSGPFMLGLGLGTLYVPCAGPVLAAITVAGATGQIGLRTVVLTVSFAVGAALPLLVFAAAGSRVAQRVTAYRKRARGFRVAGGLVMIALAVALSLNVTDALQRAIPNYTGGLEKKVAESQAVQGTLSPLSNDENVALAKCLPGSAKLDSCGQAPRLKGTQQWFNTENGRKVALGSLKGKVVLLDFWAYSCINCQRNQPYLNAWYDDYHEAGLEVIGVHSPEFAFEKSAGNLASAIAKEEIRYPVAQDNNLSTWTNYRNRYWPAKYLIDADGTVRAIRFGEGGYDETEAQIRELLVQADPDVKLPKPTSDTVRADSPGLAGTSPETYLAYSRSQNYSGTPALEPDERADYTLDEDQPEDSYSLGGRWRVGTQSVQAGEGSRIRLNANAAKIFNVLSGTGTVTVSEQGRPDRSIEVEGTPNAYPVLVEPKIGRHTLTLTYSAGIEAFTFSFG